MVSLKNVGIELKTFEVSREVGWVLLIERGWKLMKCMKLELATARCFSKALKDGVNDKRKGFHVGHREKDRGYTVQRCNNIQGAFMALEEYHGGWTPLLYICPCR